MSDAEKLENITDAIVKVLLANAFTDPSYYCKLALRVAVLIDLEIDNNLNHEKVREEMLKFWPESIKN